MSAWGKRIDGVPGGAGELKVDGPLEPAEMVPVVTDPAAPSVAEPAAVVTVPRKPVLDASVVRAVAKLR